MTREQARKILGEISSYNVYTTFHVKDGTLYVKAPGGLCQEQKAFCQEHRDALIELLTQPPESGICTRHKGLIEWTLLPYGVWVCDCYHRPCNLASPISLRDYWNR